MIFWFKSSLRIIRKKIQDQVASGNPKPNRYSRSTQFYKLGIFSAGVILVTPAVFTTFNKLIYPYFFEPYTLLANLENYLKTQKPIPKGWINTLRSEDLLALAKAHLLVVKDQNIKGAQDILDKLDSQSFKINELAAFRRLVDGQHANLQNKSDTAITLLDETLEIVSENSSYTAKSITARAYNSKAVALSRNEQNTGALALYQKAAEIYRSLGNEDYANQVIGTSLVAQRRIANNGGIDEWKIWEEAYVKAIARSTTNEKGRGIILSNGVTGYSDVLSEERDSKRQILNDTGGKLSTTLKSLELLIAESAIDEPTRVVHWINLILHECESEIHKDNPAVIEKRSAKIEELRANPQLDQAHFMAAFSICDGYVAAAKGDRSRSKKALYKAWEIATSLKANETKEQVLKALIKTTSGREREIYELRNQIITASSKSLEQDFEMTITDLSEVIKKIREAH
jgi:galactokinase